MDLKEFQSQSEPVPPKKHPLWYKIFAVIASLFLIFLSVRGYLYWIAVG